MKGGVRRIQENVLWVSLLQGKKKKEGLVHKWDKGRGPAAWAHTRRHRSNIWEQTEKLSHSFAAFTSTIWRRSPEQCVKKSQEVATRSSTEGMWLKGTFAGTGTSGFGCQSPPVPPRRWPFPHSCHPSEVCLLMWMLSFVAVRADLAYCCIPTSW